MLLSCAALTALDLDPEAPKEPNDVLDELELGVELEVVLLDEVDEELVVDVVDDDLDELNPLL